MNNNYSAGTWQHFVARPDNKGLTVEQMRSKYVYEQFMYQQYLMEVANPNVPSVSAASAGGGGGRPIDPSENNYVENNYIDNYFV